MVIWAKIFCVLFSPSQIIEKGALPLLVRMMKDNPVDEQQSAAQVLWTLSFGEVRCVDQAKYCKLWHYNDVIMVAMVSQITSLTIVYSIFYSGTDQRKHQSSASLVFVRGIHRGPVNSPHKGPVTRKMLPFDDVIMKFCRRENTNPSLTKAISLSLVCMIISPQSKKEYLYFRRHKNIYWKSQIVSLSWRDFHRPSLGKQGVRLKALCGYWKTKQTVSLTKRERCRFCNEKSEIELYRISRKQELWDRVFSLFIFIQ